VDETSEVLEDLFELPMSTGSVVTSCERTSEALNPAYEEVSAVLPQQAIANVDETGWKQNAISHWLWTVVTPAYQEGAISQETWDVALDYVKDGVWEQLEAGRQVEFPKAQSLSRELMRLWDGLWVFASVEGVEPTNNVAEQALRPAVLWRKGSFGTRSEAGSRFVERILTVRETCRRQGKPLRQFVMDAVEACRRGEPAPLPNPEYRSSATIGLWFVGWENLKGVVSQALP
jgi:hypothetical protein